MTLIEPSRLRDRLRAEPDLDERIREHLRAQLGGVLPSAPGRGLDWYYDWVVLGSRSAEAFAVLQRHDRQPDLPWLDIGSGLGTFVLLCALEGRAALGIEPSAAEVALARERMARRLAGDEERVRHGVGEQLPFADASMGGALLHDVLEHVRDWRAVLREAHRVLAPGGVLYVKGPSYAVRFVEPHYRVPWLPMLPKALARPYLRLLGRDVTYLEHLGWRRRGEVLPELRRLGFELRLPRLDKLRDPASINRPWARRMVAVAGPRLGGVAGRLAEGPLQSTIDVVAVKRG